MTQPRAVKTRADLLTGAATEFARYGYPASSVNRVLGNTSSTKGALYFHFASKREMAEAILDNAADVYTDIATRWTTTDGVDPFDAIRGMVDDAAQAFADEVWLRAEARLSVEPEFSTRRPFAVWEAAVLALAGRTAESGGLRNGFTAEKFVRVLRAPLAGHRLLAHMAPAGGAVSIQNGYRESVETVLTAAATSERRRSR